MRRLLFAFLPLLLLPQVGALSTPNVTFIPSQFSAGSAFVAIAQADPTASVRVGWVVPFLQAYYGSFPKDGNRYTCYFSNTDPTANCGPTPFTTATTGVDPYTMLLEATDNQGNVANATVLVHTGGISLLTEITVLDSTVAMLVNPTGLPSSLTYQVYDTVNFSIVTSALPLNRDPFTGKFSGNVTLQPGDYFIAFVAQGAGDFGGGLVRVTIPGATGACSSPGTSGIYQLKADPVSLSGILINQNQHYEQTGTGGQPFKITNQGSTVTGLKAVVPSNLSSFLTITLDKDTLSSNDTIFFTVKLDNIASSITINTFVDLVSAGKVVGQIPVRIPVTVIGSDGTTCPTPTSTCTGSFSVQPQVWSGAFLVGTQKKTVTITSAKDSTLSGFDYSATGNVKDIVTVTPPSSVAARGSGTAEISLKPSTAGTYDGTVTIESGDSGATVLIHAEFYDDLTTNIADMKEQFDTLKGGFTEEQASTLSDPISTVETAIATAESATENGDYKEAQEAFATAQTGLSTLAVVSTVPTTPGSSEGGDILLPLLFIVVIAAGGAGAYFFLKKRKATSTEDLEEELDEL